MAKFGTDEIRRFVIVTKDGKKLSVDERLAKTLGRVRNMIRLDITKEYAKSGSTMVLDKVGSVILKKVFDWTHHHRHDPKLPEHDEENRTLGDLSSWDQNFLQVDFGTLFQLIQASIYLDVKELKELTCKSAAQMFRGKSAEEIRTMLNIKNDLSPAEQAKIMAESDWCEAGKEDLSTFNVD